MITVWKPLLAALGSRPPLAGTMGITRMRARPGLAASAGPGQQAMPVSPGCSVGRRGQQHITLSLGLSDQRTAAASALAALRICCAALGQHLQAAGLPVRALTAYSAARRWFCSSMLAVFAHLALQILVRGLQRMRHQAEARGELAELSPVCTSRRVPSSPRRIAASAWRSWFTG